MKPSSLTAFLALGDERFVSLTTFRKSGEAMPTPVWVARDGEHLVVITPSDSGNVKRIRNGGRVELRPCSRRGKVRDDAVAVSAVATVDTEADRAVELIERKYGIEYRITMLIERLLARGQKPRVALVIDYPG